MDDVLDLFVRLSVTNVVNRDRPKPGFAYSAENDTNAESGSLFSARNRNETAASFSAEDENEK